MRTILPLILIFVFASCGQQESSTDSGPGEQAVETARRAVRFLQDSVATEGGYLWAYSRDLSLRQGEYHPALSTERPPATQIWVQPPGTPAVGVALLDLWEATGDSLFLNGAKAAATALARGQLVSGGWDYRIEFNPAERSRWAYRVDLGDSPPAEGMRNVSTLDDRNTQSALRLVMRVAHATGDPAISAAAEYGLEAFRRAQFPNGAWPQRFVSEGASGDWGYSRYYTFNDATINDCINLMIEAWRLTGDERWLASARSGGEFIIASQLPAPQRGWAQQYDENMQPAHARSFEPRAVCASVTRRNMMTLIDVYLATGDERFLAPIPAAIDWLERSVIDIPPAFFEIRGREPVARGWARLYEIGTNVPIFGDRDSQVHYTFEEISEERQRGYSWYHGYTDREIRFYAEVLEKGRDAILAERSARKNPTGEAREQEIARLSPDVQNIINTLDETGRWLDDEGWIRMGRYNRNFHTLARYLKLMNADESRN